MHFFAKNYNFLTLLALLFDFVFVAVLPIIVNLLLNGRTKEDNRKEIDELTLVFLSDLTILLNSNIDNKRYIYNI